MSIPIHWASLAVYFVAFYFVLSPAWLSLFQKWNEMDAGYAHGHLVFGIFIFLVARSIRSINYNETRPSYWLMPVLVFASLLWTLSLHAHIQLIQWMLLPIMLLVFHALVFGLKVGRQLLFPILFLGFGIPVWDYLTEPLQVMAVFVMTQLLQLLDIPAYIDAFFVTIPQGSFEIADSCSGVGGLVTMLTLSFLYSYLYYSLWITRFILVLTAVLFALLANWIRIFILILVGYTTDMESGLIKDHDMFGWIIFALFLIPFFFLAYKYADWLVDDPPEVKKHGHAPASFKLTPYLIGFVCTFTLPLLIKPVVSGEKVPVPPVFTGETLPDRDLLIKPIYHGADVSVDRMLVFNDSLIQASFRAYDIQEQGKELVAYNNKPYSSDWRLIHSYKKGNFSHRLIRHRNTEQQLLVVSRFSISGLKTTSKTVAKLLEMLRPLMTKTRSSVFILTSPCEHNCSRAEASIEQYIGENSEQIEGL